MTNEHIGCSDIHTHHLAKVLNNSSPDQICGSSLRASHMSHCQTGCGTTTESTAFSALTVNNAKYFTLQHTYRTNYSQLKDSTRPLALLNAIITAALLETRVWSSQGLSLPQCYHQLCSLRIQHLVQSCQGKAATPAMTGSAGTGRAPCLTGTQADSAPLSEERWGPAAER